MANEYFSKVWGSFLRRTDIDSTTKIILINLNGRAGIRTWTCSPSNVANETGISINTVCRKFKLLETIGVLSFDCYVGAGATRFKRFVIHRDVLAAVTGKAATSNLKAAGVTVKAAGVKMTSRSKIQKEDDRNNIQKEDAYNKGACEPEPHSQKWLEMKKVEANQKMEVENTERTLRQWKKQVGVSYSENLGRRHAVGLSDEEIEKFRDL